MDFGLCSCLLYGMQSNTQIHHGHWSVQKVQSYDDMAVPHTFQTALKERSLDNAAAIQSSLVSHSSDPEHLMPV